jgi:2-polyprenyl-3-methyl-5-hydroxy-6-metoxy-1,4-benzoquinol methylase
MNCPRGQAPQASGGAAESPTLKTPGVGDYEAYWQARSLDKELRPRTREMKLLRRLLPPPKTILEVGPGAGHLFRALQTAGYAMYALDISKAVVERLEAPPGHVRQADLNAGFPDFGTRFDAILAAMVLHHLDRPQSFFEQAFKLITPGGWLILTFPNIVTLRNRLRVLAGRPPKLSPSHRNFLTPRAVLALARRAGFRVAGVRAARDKLIKKICPRLLSRELIVAARVPQ